MHIRKSYRPESNGGVRNPPLHGKMHLTKLQFTRLWLPSKVKGVDNCGMCAASTRLPNP